MSNNPVFAQRFEEVMPPGGFQVNVLYKRHPRWGSFVPASEYSRLIELGMYSEMLILLRNVGASVVLIDEKLYNEIKMSENFSASINIPETPTATATEVEASFGSTSERTGTSNNFRQLKFDNAESYAKNPQLGECRWYLYNGYFRTNGLEEILLDRCNGNRKSGEYKVAFKTDGIMASSRDLNIKVQKILGVCAKVERATKSGTEYEFNVRFADGDKGVEEVLQSMTLMGKSVSSARRSLSRLANMRAAFHAERSSVREDAKLATASGQYVGVDEWTKKGLTWTDWILSSPPDQMLTIPFVFYGPRGCGKTSLINTWMAFVNMSPLGFLHEGNHLWCLTDEGHGHLHNSLIQHVHFNPELSQHEALQPIPEMEAIEYCEKNQVRLLFHDTVSARDATSDVEGNNFPFGVQILVLDARKVLTALETQDTAFVNDVENFLGADPMPSSTLKRYPPMCAILTMSNELSKDEERDIRDYFKSTFKVKNVFTCPTLQEPTPEDRSKYLGNAKFRHDYDSKWDSLGCRSIGALTKMSNAIAQVEQQNWILLQQNPSRRPISLAERLGGWLQALVRQQNE